MPHTIVVPGFERRDGRGIFREVINGFDARSLVCGEMKAGAVLGRNYPESYWYKQSLKLLGQENRQAQRRTASRK